MKGIVYQIVCNIVPNDRYVGSTYLPLNQRLRQHKKLDCCSRQIIVRGDYTTSVLEEIEFNEIAELRRLEQDYMDKLVCINKQRAYIKDRLLIWRQERAKYREKHRDTLNAKSVCDCGGRYTYKNIHKHQKSIKHQDFIQAQKAPA
jgi:hypothetical protein